MRSQAATISAGSHPAGGRHHVEAFPHGAALPGPQLGQELFQRLANRHDRFEGLPAQHALGEFRFELSSSVSMTFTDAWT